MSDAHEAKDLFALSPLEKKRVLVRARQLFDEARTHKRSIAQSGFQLGVVLGELKDKLTFGVLGFESFEALCTTGLQISVSFAHQLVAVADHFSEKVVNEIGTPKAAALIGLARELGGTHSPSALLTRRDLDVGRGERVDVRAASAVTLRTIARDLRARAPREDRPGMQLTKDDRAYAANIEKALKKAGAERATVTAIAGPKAVGGKLRIEVSIRDGSVLGHILSEIKPPRE
jgi:hypothetical protein